MAQNNIYTDLDMNLTMNPVTGDIVIKKDIESIRQSVRCLLQTRYFDRLMNPQIGSNLHDLLFKPLDMFYLEMVKLEIDALFKTFEPRVKIVNLQTQIDENQNKVYIIIEYYIFNLDKTDTYIYAVNRIR